MTLPIFPTMPIGWNSKKTFNWQATIVMSASGKRKAMTSQAYPLVSIACSLVGLTQAQVKDVQGFFCAQRGQVEPFLWKDPEDYKLENYQIGIGNGTTSDYQLYYPFDTFLWPVRDVDASTLRVYIDGTATTNFTLRDNGIVRFSTTPRTGAILRASYEWYWRVAFDDEDLAAAAIFSDINEVSAIKLVTVR